MSMIDTFKSMWKVTTAPAPLRPKSEYMRGGRGILFSGWRPALRETSDEVALAWDAAAARAKDVIQNSGWLAGAIDQSVSNVVGTGLRLKAMPEYEQLGMNDQQAREWSRLVEQRWELWSRSPIECDIEGRRNFGQMQAAALRSWFATGEVVAELPYRKRGQYGTKVRMLPSQRIVRKTDKMLNIVQGVRMDVDGFPIAYLAERNDPIMGKVEYEVPARDAMGRPRVVHIFDGDVGAVRGITPLTPALQVARQFDQLADATLTAAIIQTVFAATVTSEQPTEEMLQSLLTPSEQAKMMATGGAPIDAYFDASGGWYQNTTINMGINGRIAHLFPGQKLDFHSPSNPSAAYKDFSLHLLREIARCLGMTYESATGDYSGATYSSVRMATNEIFQITLYRRKNIIAPLCQAAFEAWLEEEIELGFIPFPGGTAGFLQNRAAAARAEWRGSPKPQADDNKIASAHQVWRQMGVITDEMIANDLGADIEDVYMQLSREKQMREQYGLPESSVSGSAIGFNQQQVIQSDTPDSPDDQQDPSSDQPDPADPSNAGAAYYGS